MEKMSKEKEKPNTSRRSSRYHQGRFRPKNPEKYQGDPSQIWFRSSWERILMRWLDHHPSILSWGSEEITIPYISPVDNKRHRYFPDFIVKKKSKDGSINTVVIEVKPKKELFPPKEPRRKGKRYLTEMATYAINQEKWEAAKRFCKEFGWEFVVMTEDELFGKGKNK